jgi:hypothetical protein
LMALSTLTAALPGFLADHHGFRRPAMARQFPHIGQAFGRYRTHSAVSVLSRHAARRTVGLGLILNRAKPDMEGYPMKKLVVSIIAIGFTTAAFAQAVPEFPAVDTDANASASLAEAQAALPGLTPEQFTAADTDASGGLSAEEYAALVTAAGGTPAPAAP